MISFCSLYRTFSSGICEKVAVMVQGKLCFSQLLQSFLIRSQDSSWNEATFVTSHERDASQPHYRYSSQSFYSHILPFFSSTGTRGITTTTHLLPLSIICYHGDRHTDAHCYCNTGSGTRSGKSKYTHPNSFLFLSSQVWLLLSYAERDARRLVRCCALANLLKLALRAPQCWTSPMMEVPHGWHSWLVSCVSLHTVGIA